MLRIGSAQMAAVERALESRFRDELLGHIRESYPAYSKLSEPILGGLLDTALQRAMGYGLNSPQSIAQFVALMAAVAPNFDLHPAVHAILVNPALPANGRIEALVDRLPDKVWDEVQAQASSIGWFLESDSFGMGAAGRIAAALGKALRAGAAGTGRKVSSEESSQAAAAAAKHGWHSEDARFVFAAAWLLYGEGFDTLGDRFPWLSDVFDPGSAVKTQVVLMRMRLALDRQIWL